MKYEKEWYTCDRCGRRIEDYEMIPFSNQPGGVRKIFRDIFDPKTREEMATLYAKTAEGPRGYISDRYLVGKKILCMEIMEYYDCKSREIHLCGKCRKAFERFLRNED
ncbi:MAG: hypothetical protein HFG89_00520 [Dorea sp.]|jgi:hypothetical protein|nr:hypothetical protein [Dorea sp.]